VQSKFESKRKNEFNIPTHHGASCGLTVTCWTVHHWKNLTTSHTSAHKDTDKPQYPIQYSGFLSRDVSTSSWHVSFTRLCPARHFRTWLTTYTWFRKVQDVDSARPPTDRVLFHGRTTRLVTEALLPPGHVLRTASQYTCTLLVHVQLHLLLQPFTSSWRHSCFSSHFRTSSSDITKYVTVNFVMAIAILDTLYNSDWLTDLFICWGRQWQWWWWWS